MCVDNGVPALVTFFVTVSSINDHSTCGATRCLWIPRKACTADKCVLCCSPSLGRKESNVVICSSPNVVSTVCDIQNCYYCGYQRFAGYPLHCVWSWVYSVRQRARAAAEPLIWTGHFASLRCWVSSSVDWKWLSFDIFFTFWVTLINNWLVSQAYSLLTEKKNPDFQKSFSAWRWKWLKKRVQSLSVTLTEPIFSALHGLRCCGT